MALRYENWKVSFANKEQKEWVYGENPSSIYVCPRFTT